MIYTTHYASPIGPLTLASDGKSLTGLWLEGQKYFPDLDPFCVQPALPAFTAAAAWLDRYFAGEKPCPGELPLSPAGSAFQRRVWALLAEIPYGKTVTYGELAARLGSSARAVGGAVGRNPISIILPCHRVLGAGGRLTGYAGGLDRKIQLLHHEGAYFRLS